MTAPVAPVVAAPFVAHSAAFDTLAAPFAASIKGRPDAEDLVNAFVNQHAQDIIQAIKHQLTAKA